MPTFASCALATVWKLCVRPRRCATARQRSGIHGCSGSQRWFRIPRSMSAASASTGSAAIPSTTASAPTSNSSFAISTSPNSVPHICRSAWSPCAWAVRPPQAGGRMSRSTARISAPSALMAYGRACLLFTSSIYSRFGGLCSRESNWELRVEELRVGEWLDS